MPRAPRQIQTDVIYHVINRANGRRAIFEKDGDFHAFLKVLTEAVKRYRVDLLAWCIMNNHWHLVLCPRADRQLEKFMQWLTVTHVRRHHGYHDQAIGHLYQGRYKHFPVEQDDYFLTLCRYVEANPRRAGIVKRAEDWPWSSLRQRMQRVTTPLLAAWPVDRPRDWKQLVNEPMPADRLRQVRQSLNRGRPLGSDPWVKRMATQLGLQSTLHSIGRPQKPVESLSPRQRRRRKATIAVENGHNGV